MEVEDLIWQRSYEGTERGEQVSFVENSSSYHSRAHTMAALNYIVFVIKSAMYKRHDSLSLI
jgi:hypothetical protein